MSTVLTENIVLSRTRQHDLSRVRKLNCWGSELSDVSIVERMPHVEVLSLTINNITTLRDFGACKNLQELYLRKNKIADLNELYYIQELPNLKKLTLNENPCAEHPNYRYTVLRALPYLELLDNVPVTSEEVYKAQTLGNEISDPTIEPPLRPHSINGNQQHHVQQNNQLSTESTQLSTQNHEEEDYSYEAYEEEAAEINQEENVQFREHSRNDLDKQSLHGTAPVTSQVSSAASSEASQSPRLKHKQANQSQRHSLPVSSSSPTDTNHDEWKENNTKQATTPVNSSSSSSSSMPSILIPSRRYGFQSIQQLASNQHKGLSKGGKNRNANILSAVLCLIKELDYASLEVAETHIHCRMEEMEEQG